MTVVVRGRLTHFWKELREDPTESHKPRACWDDADSDLEGVPSEDGDLPFTDYMLWETDDQPATGNILTVLGASATT